MWATRSAQRCSALMSAGVLVGFSRGDRGVVGGAGVPSSVTFSSRGAGPVSAGRSSERMRPRSIVMTRSARSASAGSWVMWTTAIPCWGRDERRLSISERPARSIMAVDSSEMSRRGERARAPASASL